MTHVWLETICVLVLALGVAWGIAPRLATLTTDK